MTASATFAARAGAMLGAALLLAAAGCGTPRVAAPPAEGAGDFKLSDRDLRAAGALASYGAGLISEGELGLSNPETMGRFLAAADAAPDRPELLIKAAALHLHRGDAARAVELLEKAAARNPRHVAARVSLGMSYEASGRIGDASAQYRRAARLDPALHTPYERLAALCFAQKKDRSALRWLARGLRSARDTASVVAACCTLGTQFVAAGQVARAIPCFEAVIAQDPSRKSEFYELFGDIHAKAGNRDEAVRWYEKSCRADPPRADPFLKLADVRLQDDPAAALGALRRARERLPDDPRVLFAVGFMLVTDERFAEAVDAFARTQDLVVGGQDGSELDSRFYLYYGMACERAGQTNRAVEIFEQGVALYPDSHEMLNYLAYTWAVAGTNLDTALAYANRALAHEPDNGAYLDTLGWILFRQNRPADALAQIRRALDRLKDDPTITDHAGDICEAMADRAGAVSFWTRSLSLDPDNEAVADKLRARGADIEAIRRQAQSAGAGANTE